MTTRAWVRLGATACLSGVPAALQACPYCMGAADGPMADGLNAGILVLLGVTGVVLGGFATAMAVFVRRARAVERRVAVQEPHPARLVVEQQA